MIATFKPGYVYRCIWKENLDFYYINYITSQPNPDTVYGRCVATTDVAYMTDNTSNFNECKWALTKVHEVAHSITELGHIDDFPEYLI